ncbi:MAG TPA: gluconokinase [Thermodesulfobacteriota bacterium]
MTASLVLALDIGTSSVRAVLFDEAGRQVDGGLADRPHAPDVTPDGGAELDPGALLSRTAAAIDEVLVAAGGRATAIRAVGLATFWHGLMGTDAADTPVTPLYLWADVRASAHAARLAERLGADALHARTGCPVHASFLPAKLLWLGETRPDPFRRAAWWGSFGEWLHRRLFGRPDAPASLSMASATGLLDQTTGRWDETILGAIGLDPRRLSPIGDLDNVSQGLAPEWARRWPPLARVPWLPAVGDGATGQIGSGCTSSDRIALNVGTSSALRVLVDGPVVPPPPGLFGYRLDGRQGVVGGALNEGGNVVAWARETFRLPAGAEMEAVLERLPPDAHGLTVLPWLMGERAPGWRGDLTGTITGLSLATRPIDLLHALMEAVALRLALVEERLERRVPPEAVVVASGGAMLASPAWRRIVADALGRPVVASGEPEASARGAALLALRETGLLSSLQHAPARLGARLDPEPARHATYRAARDRQQALDERLFAR